MNLELIFKFSIGHVYGRFISKEYLDINILNINSKSNFERFIGIVNCDE